MVGLGAYTGQVAGESINQALATKTLLSGASRASTAGEQLTLPGFMELSALCEAVAILDHVQTIASADNFTHPLIEQLTSCGILSELKPTLTRDEALVILRRLPGDLKNRLPADIGMAGIADPSVLAASDKVQPEATSLLVNSAATAPRLQLDGLIHWVESLPNYPSMVDNIATQNRVYRSFGYLVVAASHGMDYFPDADRALFVSAILQRTYRSLPRELYTRIAQAMQGADGEGAETIPELDLQVQLPIPPITALVLDRCQSVTDIGDKLLEVREELAGYRKYFRKFKAELQDVSTMKQRRELQRKYQRLLRTASGPDCELIGAQEMLSFGEKIAAVAAAPQSPTSYSAALITQPLEWIHRWWTRRPLAVLFRLDGKLPNMTTYRSLVSKLWGRDAQDRLLEQLVYQAREVDRLMSPAAGGDAALGVSLPAEGWWTRGRSGRLRALLSRPRCSPYRDRSWRGRRGCSAGVRSPADPVSRSTRTRSPC